MLEVDIHSIINSLYLKEVSNKQFTEEELITVKRMIIEKIAHHHKFLIILSNLLNIFPTKFHFRITSIMKDILNKGRNINLLDIDNLFFIKEQVEKVIIPSYQFISISHDVDYLEGYNNIEKIIKVEDNLGIKSTFFFLIHGRYIIDEPFIKELASAGYEIGLHGLWHDIALAYRDKNNIRCFLKRAFNDLPVKIYGFRSPGLSLSINLINILKEFDIVYDSSKILISHNANLISPHRPFKFSREGLWEVPLTIQDSLFFRDLKWSTVKTLDFLKELTVKLINYHSCCVFNFHPVLLINRLDFYKNFLMFLKDIPNVNIQLIIESVKRLNEIYENIIT